MTDTLRSFIYENFLFGDEAAMPADDDSLLDAGVIDSTGVLELIEFLEERFGIEVQDDETIPDNLDSISRLAAFVQSKRSGNGQSE